MAKPKLKKQDVIDALKFIDENGVPKQNESTMYMLVGDNGKKYPPKYVVAVADHLANATDISTPRSNAQVARDILEGQGFTIEIKQAAETKAANQEEPVQQFKGYRNPFSSKLIESKNLIFRGAPGTGKSYLAKEIAADIISNGYFDDYTLLTDEQKKQVEFVQFHPSYDYSDFVEGLRPKINDDGTMGFELQDGIFKKFVARARKNYEDSQKSRETVEKEVTVQESMTEFFSGVEFGVDTFKTINGNEFTITGVDDGHIHISIPGNASVNRLVLNLDEVRKMLESGQKFEKIKDITSFFGKTFATQGYSYDFAIYKAIKAKKSTVSKAKAKQEELKKYIFIIDEINRGNLSKIFGELFMLIESDKRGQQMRLLYSDEMFSVPENVYIIGMMNTADRSLAMLDYALRRRFAFVTINPAFDSDGFIKYQKSLANAKFNRLIDCVKELNAAIAADDALGEGFCIGHSYFCNIQPDSQPDLSFIVEYEILPLISEYWFDDRPTVNKWADRLRGAIR